MLLGALPSTRSLPRGRLWGRWERPWTGPEQSEAGFGTRNFASITPARLGLNSGFTRVVSWAGGWGGVQLSLGVGSSVCGTAGPHCHSQSALDGAPTPACSWTGTPPWESGANTCLTCSLRR